MSELIEIGMDLDDAIEPYAVEDGEYGVVINGAEYNAVKNYIKVRLGVTDEEHVFAREIAHFVHIPSAGMENKRLNACKLAMKRFGEAFNINMAGKLDLEDWKGKEARAFVACTENEQYGKQNKIKRWIG